MQIWSCKIGEANYDKVPDGANLPMRQAVQAAFKKLTGEDAQFTFSGWGAQLSASERRVVDNAKPDIVELWIEGYQDQGNSGTAHFLGNFEGPTLREAVINYRKYRHTKNRDDDYPWEIIDFDKLMSLGCRFFNNEADAREAFG